ncbi:uncharacterized protein LOC107868765 [Capsicum annuum]|uniref:uncharacterized protein LOC107868765 n=1 Tax=Capsicum annuum TaxID=4072 RepID=UPI0007BF6D19|nr:uncharacterized protein LOC107868765 [Capsicum annuum]
MAKAYRKEDFDYIMSKVGKVDPRVKEYLEKIRYDKWSRCHSPVNGGRMMTSNIAECINGCLVKARVLPILGFLEEVRILFVAWNCKNSETASYTNTTLGRRFQEILTDNGVKLLQMTVKAVGSYLYNVYESGRRYIVDIDARVTVAELYRPNTIVKTYELPIIPMPDMKDWIVSDFVDADEVLPLKYRRPPGRTKKGRHLKSSESFTSSNHCGKCGLAGHNRRTCGFFPKES